MILNNTNKNSTYILYIWQSFLFFLNDKSTIILTTILKPNKIYFKINFIGEKMYYEKIENKKSKDWIYNEIDVIGNGVISTNEIF